MRDDAARWHIGIRFVPGGKRRPFWVSRWLAHPCADLARPFEIGTRAAHHGSPCSHDWYDSGDELRCLHCPATHPER